MPPRVPRKITFIRVVAALILNAGHALLNSAVLTEIKAKLPIQSEHIAFP